MNLTLGLDLALVSVVLLLGRTAALSSLLGALVSGLGLALGSFAAKALGPDLARPLVLGLHFGALWAGFFLIGSQFAPAQLSVFPLGIGAWLFLDISFWRTTGVFLDSATVSTPGELSPKVLILCVEICLVIGFWTGRKTR